MTRAERFELQSKAERAAQRHREYVERLRRERAERALLERRLDERRQKQFAELRQDVAAQRLAEQQQLRREGAAAHERTARAGQEAARQTAPREEGERRQQRREELTAQRIEARRELEAARNRANTLRLREAARRSADCGARTEESQQHQARRKSLAAQQLEETGQWRRNAAATHQQVKVLRERGVAWQQARRQVLQGERERQFQVRASLAAQRVEGHRELRADAVAGQRKSAALRAREAARRRSLWTVRAEGRQKPAEPPEDFTARRLEELRQRVREEKAVWERMGALRAREADRRQGDRQLLHQQRDRVGRAQQDLRAERVEEHRQLHADAEATKQRKAALGAREAARRSDEIRTLAAAAPHPGAAVRAQLAGPPSPTLPEEPLEGLLWLSTVESYVVDENGDAVNLRGITVQGLDTVAPMSSQSFAEALSLDDINLSTIADLWGVNLVRLPFQAQTMLTGNGSVSANDFLAGLDEVVAALAESRVYTLLALKAPPGATTTPLPDQNTFDCWSLLAQHYQDEAAVLFEIFSAALPIAGDWLGAAPVLIGTIRRQHPASLLFVGNGSAGADSTGLPLRFTTGVPTPNLVYTLRVVPEHQFSPEEELQLALLAKSFPVFASDWSGSTGSDLGRSAEIAADTFSRYGVDWAASNWNAEPRLVVNARGHDFIPTRWGLSVRRAMTLPTKEPLTKLLPHEMEGN